MKGMDRIERQLRKGAFYLYTIKDGQHEVLVNKRRFRKQHSEDREEARNRIYTRVKDTLVHAFNTSPYYREAWAKTGFHPNEFNRLEDLGRLPVVTKEVIEKNKERMISGLYKKQDLVVSYTGGSSGNCTSFFMDRGCRTRRVGRQWGILDLCGYGPGDRAGLIWGAGQDLGNRDDTLGFSLKRRLRIFSTARETLHCNPLSEKSMHEYYTRLRNFEPRVLYGYPSAMCAFAEFIREKGMPPLQVKNIYCTAERLTGDQRKLLQENFTGDVFNLYCTREHGCIGFECKEHNGFHLDTGSVYVEISNRREGSGSGVPGEILVTDLLNRGMPLIRNRIGDRGELSRDPCKCGSPLPLLSRFQGRVTDMLYRDDGSRVPGLLLIDMFLDIPEVRDIQIIQERREEVDMYLVGKDPFNPDIENLAIMETRKYLGETMKVNIKPVSEIPRNNNSGKHQEVICRVPRRPGAARLSKEGARRVSFPPEQGACKRKQPADVHREGSC